MSTFTVTNIGDTGAGSLRYEIGQANSNAGASTIDFDSTVFNSALTITLTGSQLELSNTSGTETIDGPAAGVTVSGGGLSRVFRVDANVTASISGLTIAGGSVSGAGAGLANYGGTTTLTECAVTANSANNGGGVYTNNSGTTTLTNCIVSGNTGTNGGGLYTNDYGTSTLTDCTLIGNSAYDNGGGLFNAFGTTTLTNCTVSGNSAGIIGGGLYDLIGKTTLSGTAFIGNFASVNGGGLFDTLGTSTLTDCTFYGNSASVNGGGLFINLGTTALNYCSLSGSSAAVNGGGLYNDGGTADLANCTVSGNFTGNNGGGLYNLSGTTTLTDVTLTGNSAEHGGGLANSGGTTTLTEASVSGNTAEDGGGLYNFNGTAALTNVSVSGNVASNGGGLSSYDGTTTLTDCTVNGNSASSGDGGGVFNDLGTTTLLNCSVSGNSATVGGGVATYYFGSTTLTNCTVSGNSAASDGGGVVTENSTATLTNSTVSGNSAGGNGGGLYTSTAGTTRLTNVTVSGNTAGGFGGGLDNSDGKVTIGNTIVAENTASASGPDALGTFASSGHNLIGDTDDSFGWADTDLTGTSTQPLNPVLAALGDYGGPTQTVALLPGSPAIDSGSNALIPDGITTDQRGLPRSVNGVVDIGAFESSGFTIAATSGSGQSTAVFTEFSAPLVATVTANNRIEPVAGGLVSFTAPQAGASANLTGSPATISATGTVSVTAAANGIGGIYSVSAGARGIATAAIFGLTNKWVPTFSVLSRYIVYGTPTTTLTGHLGSGTAYPTGSIVSITLNSVTDTSTVDSSGDFTATFSTATLGVVGGPYAVTYAFAGNPTFTAATDTSTTVTVIPAPLTITAHGVSRVYGASDPTLGVTYTGFVNGETPSALGGGLSVVDSTPAATTSVGSYPGAITASGPISTNYTITYVAGTLTVTPAALTITDNGVSRVYGAFDPTLGVVYAGFVNGETSSVLGGTLSVVDLKAATTTSVGSYAGAITASGQTSTNYTITYVAGDLTVTPAALTVTADGLSRVYGASDSTLGVTYTGFVNGETSGVLGGTLSVVDSHAAPTTAVSSYSEAIIASGQTSTNYTITYAAGDLDGHAGCRSRRYGQRCVTSLRCFGPDVGSNLLGIRE